MQRIFTAIVLSLGGWFAAAAGAVDRLPTPPAGPIAEVAWQSDYHTALELAASEQKLVLLWFQDPANAEQSGALESALFSREPIAEVLRERFIALQVPTTFVAGSGEQGSGGKKVELLKHPAFAEMHGAAGLAIIDMIDRDSPHFRQVVSIFPFRRAAISADQLRILLDLPRGSLTQRTLIFAVRAHPEAPASTRGHFSQILAREAENHAWHQASIALQGHHNWDSRFHAINAQLPGGLAAREVCAESWPGQNLMEAAEECVHSWRQSSGHWEAVRSRHQLFSYDMKRGANGIWYAAGIFAGR